MSPSNQMSQADEQIWTTDEVVLRDHDELEGALLLPVASLVATATAPMEGEAVVVSEQPVAWNVPLVNSSEHVTQDRVVLVSDDTSSSNDKARVQSAQTSGLIAAETEKEGIRKANQNVLSQQYYQRESVRTANRMAKESDRRLHTNKQKRTTTTTTTTIANHPDSHDMSSMSETMYDSLLPSPAICENTPKQQHGTISSSFAISSLPPTEEPKEEATKQEQKPAAGATGYNVQDYTFSSDAYETGNYDVSEYKSVYD